VREGAD
jgi:small subunit ribosomal protein S17